MLLITKKKHADNIRSGRKSIEIRCGQRYAGIVAGDSISINGHFRRQVDKVEHFNNREELLSAMKEIYYETGFDSFE